MKKKLQDFLEYLKGLPNVAQVTVDFHNASRKTMDAIDQVINGIGTKMNININVKDTMTTYTYHYKLKSVFQRTPASDLIDACMEIDKWLTKDPLNTFRKLYSDLDKSMSLYGTGINKRCDSIIGNWNTLSCMATLPTLEMLFYKYKINENGKNIHTNALLQLLNSCCRLFLNVSFSVEPTTMDGVDSESDDLVMFDISTGYYHYEDDITNSEPEFVIDYLQKDIVKYRNNQRLLTYISWILTNAEGTPVSPEDVKTRYIEMIKKNDPDVKDLKFSLDYLDKVDSYLERIDEMIQTTLNNHLSVNSIYDNEFESAIICVKPKTCYRHEIDLIIHSVLKPFVDGYIKSRLKAWKNQQIHVNIHWIL